MLDLRLSDYDKLKMKLNLVLNGDLELLEKSIVLDNRKVIINLDECYKIGA